jgi:hypothetical protein
VTKANRLKYMRLSREESSEVCCDNSPIFNTPLEQLAKSFGLLLTVHRRTYRATVP